MTFILGVLSGILITFGFALLSVSSDQDDIVDNHTDFR
jgi:glucose uptake protein GlcU